ncbi:MAG: S-layer homology domain-containing protein, partial [Bacillota bacterium]
MLRRLIGTSLILALLLLLSPTVSAYYACRVTSIEDMEEAFLKGFSEGHGQIVLSYEATAEQCLRDIKTVEERLATATADYGVVSVRRMVPSPADEENFHFLQFFMTYDMSRRNPARAFPEPNEPSEWAKAEIGRADSLDLTTPGTWYGYKIGITRDHFAKLMLNLYEKATGNKLDRSGVATQFRDTNDPEVRLAAELGLIGGVGDDRFDPNGLLTREQ